MSAAQRAGEDQISTSKKIAMTAPVEQNQVNGTWAINFTMPSEYTLKTLPKPNNTAVILSALPSQTFITIQFSGRSSIENISTHESKLKAFVIKNNIKIQDDFEIIDATGKVLIPGLIDDQVHFREPGLTHKATIKSESKAAIAGGITSFIEMPNTNPQTISVKELKRKFK